MDLNKLALPIPKKLSPDSNLKPFPVDKIPEVDGEKPFTGIFNGLSVEVFDIESVNQIYSNGCFGLSTKTKSVPLILHKFVQTKSFTQPQYDQKIAWDTKFINQNPETVMINLLLTEQSCETEANIKYVEHESDQFNETDENIYENEEEENKTNQNEVINCDKSEEIGTMCNAQNYKNQTKSRQTDTEKIQAVLNLVTDPFPIEETLALLPVEAFFLYYSLRCLKIMNFQQTHEFTTEELLDRFCTVNPKFIQEFIVYHFYRSKSWVVRSGLKFGGDFLLYYKGPSYYHASYVVVVNDDKDETNKLDMQSNYRVADSTNKDMILATINRPSGLEYSNRIECLRQLDKFTITEIIPKRFTLSLLSQSQPSQS